MRFVFLPVFAALALALAAPAAVAAPAAKAAQADERAPLTGISAIRVGNYGSPSVLLQGREQVGPLLDELKALRAKPWRRGDTRLSCYATLLLVHAGKTVGYFRISPEFVVEWPLEKGKPSYTLPVAEGDLPRISKLLSEITPPKNCN